MPWKVRLTDLNHSQINKYHPLRVVIGIIECDTKILVGQRPEGKSLSGYWEFPGGKIEAGESSLIALKRELREELDIEVITTTFWFNHTYIYPDKTVLLDIFRINEFLGEPRSKEQQALQWVTKSELKKLHFLEGNALIIEKL